MACGACLVAGAAYVATTDPGDSNGFIPCPYYTLTGLWCPGCGLTRAAHHVLRGDLVQALRYNAFIVVVMVTIAAAWAMWLWRAVMMRPPGRLTAFIAQPKVAGTAIAAMVMFAVIRNLPGLDMLRG